MVFNYSKVKALNLSKALPVAALMIVLSAPAGLAWVDGEHTNKEAYAGALAMVQTDRQQADVLREERVSEIEDHYGDADLFKRYIINRPLRAV